MSEHVFQREKIEDIQNLKDLKKYVCAKNAYMNDWYMSCIDCKDRFTCRTGKQANRLMEQMTVKEPEVVKTSEMKLRDNVIHIFTLPDPVKELLKTATCAKPMSIYQRVLHWKKKFPDLEDKFGMLNKVRFLWRKPYDSMEIPDILKMLYPEKEENAVYLPEAGETVLVKKDDISQAQAEVKEQGAVQENAAEEVSLQDFLDEFVPLSETTVPAREPEGEREAYISYSEKLIRKLEEERVKCEQRIRTIDSQIAAIRTVQKIESDIFQE